VSAPESSATVAPDPLRGIAPVLLAPLGAGFGASVFAEGFYDITVWGPIGIGLLALLLALVVWAPARIRGPAAAALGALVALSLWSWISISWAESDEQAQIATARWMMYAAAFGVFLLLLRNRRDRLLVLGSTAAGVLAVALYVAVTMLGSDGPSLFLGGRLRDPLGYPNGQAGYFLVGLWPFVALAELARKPLLAGVGMAGAFLIACLLLVGQTRGVLPGVGVSAVAVLLLVPGRGRRLWVLIVIGVALAVCSDPLLDVYRDAPAGSGVELPRTLTENAATAMLLGALVLGVLWTCVQYLLSGPVRRAAGDEQTGVVLARLATAAAIAIVAIGALGVLAAVDDPAGKVKRQYDEFVNLQVGDERTDSRFFSGGGYRYDYWRVALGQFKDNPLKGLGAGNYDRTYFLERRTNEDIRQPHSIELQMLSELGLVGGVALLAFLLSAGAGLWAHARRSRENDLDRVVAVAAGGALIAWLAHTSVDWLHITPGITGMALVAAAVLVSPWVTPSRARFRSPVRLAATAATALAVVAATQTLAKPTAANYLRIDSQDELASDPVKVLKHANQALAIQDDSMRALYAKSAAYARLDRYGDARAALSEAARLEPHDHLPWALLGDLAGRRGGFGAARRYYRRAYRLNPKSAQLEQLTNDPRSALRGLGN
jgi:hypothetical protein